ncbi:efflux RND transporter permease subunit [Virgisporangium aurantiacum]|uniref:Hydrogenase expression protein n=1 Tax=Virgisporangium aurantiacum TaxID=175570 RepID=A0A8J4EA25_9ACTN|nr:efflux RND transporter permease subunit [Virgisporangium aurantiacum]GIJ64332.1 hydrogenase expression protein [Virgisporangium aurantiacum]
MSFLSRISLANRKLVALLTALIVGLGVYATLSLKQQLLPDLSFPAVTVVATYPGAAPEVVEEQVTGRIEKAVEGLDGVESTTSTSQQGSVQVMVSFSFDTDIDEASADVEQAVSRISSSLPQGVTPEVLTGSTGDLPTMVLAVTSDGDQRKLAADLDDKVVPALRGVDGVNDVSVSGVRDQVVTVTPNAAALAKAGLSTQSVINALSTLGGTSSAGQITSDGRNLSLAVGKPVASLQQILDLWLSAATPASAGGQAGPGSSGAPQAGGPPSAGTTQSPAGSSVAAAAAPVQLKDVATVTIADAPATSITRTDGKPSLGISITMDHGGSSPAISDDVRAKLPELQAALGDNAKLVVVSDSGPSVSDSVDGLVEEGALGLAMAILVIVLFLRSARATIVTAVSIPLSLLVALIAVWQRGYSLNILTLGALTIAIGRVVDDSIVVLENIKRHLGYGEDRRTAVLSAVREVASAVTSSTLTTVAVFLPVAFVSGFVGQLFGSFSITVSAAMLASLLVSLTVVPVLAYWFLKAPKDAAGVPADEYRARVEERERHGVLPRIYLPVITWAVGHRKSVLAGAVVLLIATFAMAGGLKTTFLGDSGEDSIRVNQALPAGADLATTDAAAKKVEQALSSVDGVQSYQVVIGSSGGFFGARTANNVSYTLTLASDADSSKVTDAVRDTLATITDAGDLTIGGSGPGGADGPGGSSTISVSIRADNDETLSQATQQVQQAMAEVSQVTDVQSDLSESAPQISVVPNGEAAARYGLATAAIVSALRQSVEGTTVTQVTLDGAAHDVVVKTTTTAPNSLDAVKAITLPTSSGPVRLDQVATVTQVDGPVQRTHVDGERTNTVTATPVGDNTGAASTAVTDKLETLTLPAGASYEIGGVTADQGEAFSQLILAMVAAIALVFLILVAVFRSIRQTLILLVSIPFAFIGAFGLLLVTGTPLGVAALIGILMLIGIVVTNAIVLMDLVNQYREQGMTVIDAVVEGGRRRLRPILMTALATIFALLPMALGITGEGGFISTPLAVVVIGGLITSTLLTLVLIPVLYTMVETRRERRQARKQSHVPQSEHVTEPVPVS